MDEDYFISPQETYLSIPNTTKIWYQTKDKGIYSQYQNDQ